MSNQPAMLNKTEVAWVRSPVGVVEVEVEGGTLVRLAFVDDDDSVDGRSGSHEAPAGEGPAKIVDVLNGYFAGDLHALDRVAIDLRGTPFQKSVWRALSEIAPGDLISYGQLAEQAGSPRAARAVGGAVGSNPIAIVVPCHRVIRSDGSIGGFGGGLAWKRWLLSHEGIEGELVAAPAG